MKMTKHIVVSAIAGTALYQITGSKQMAISLFLGGVFIDLDHLYDYILLSKEKFSLNTFFSWFNEIRWQRVYVMFHSYELYMLLLLFAFWFRNDVILGLSIGIGIHLIMDQIGNAQIMKDVRLSSWFYFLSFRYASNFEKKRMIVNRD